MHLSFNAIIVICLVLYVIWMAARKTFALCGAGRGTKHLVTAGQCFVESNAWMKGAPSSIWRICTNQLEDPQ